MSDKAWNYFFYLALIVIPALSIFGRELQSLVSDNNFIELAEYIIGAGLLATSALIIAFKPNSPINWPLVLVALIIFVLIPYQLDRYEERLHFICFGMLGFTAYRSFGVQMAALLTCSAGLGDEVLQYFLPSRVGDWRDVFMNCFAGLSALLIAHKGTK